MYSGSDQTRRMVVDVIGYLFIALFVYAAINKLLDYEKFKAQMGQSPMLVHHIWYLVWAVPAVELLIAILLFISRTFLTGLYASFTLMLLFTIYIIVILTSGEKIPCACGGILQDMSWIQHLIFNMVFVVLGILGILFKRRLDKKADGLIKDILLQ